MCEFPLVTAKAHVELVGDTIIFDVGIRQVTITGPFTPLLFAAVLPQFSGTVSLENIICSVSDRIQREVVEEFVRVLSQKRIIYDGAAHSPILKHAIDSDSVLDFLASKQIGIISSYGPVHKLPGESKMPIFFKAHLGPLSRTRHNNAGIGKGNTEKSALVPALAEAIERYCALCPNERNLTFAKRSQLDAPSVDPHEFVLYSSKQYATPGFPYLPFNDDRPIHWCRAVEVGSNSMYFVPAQLVFLRLGRSAMTDRLVPMTSNGLAAGPTMHEAILSGLLELVERDALIRNWVNSQSCDQIALAKYPSIEGEIIQHYRKHNIDIKLFLMNSDIAAYAIMAIATSTDGRPPYVTVGMGCSLDPEDAVKKAIFELCQVRHGEICRMKNRTLSQKASSPQRIFSPEDHSGYYSRVEMPSAFKFLESGVRRPLQHLPSYSRGNALDNLEHILLQLYNHGMRIFYVDLTLPELRGIAITSVRVMVTKLQPMHFGFGMERHGGNRLFISRVAAVEDKMNAFPHPLG